MRVADLLAPQGAENQGKPLHEFLVAHDLPRNLPSRDRSEVKEPLPLIRPPELADVAGVVPTGEAEPPHAL